MSQSVDVPQEEPSSSGTSNPYKRKRSSNFTNAESFALLATWKRHKKRDPTMGGNRSTKFWESISKSMTQIGHGRSGQECKSRFNNLKTEFNRIKDDKGHGSHRFPFYSFLRDALAADNNNDSKATTTANEKTSTATTQVVVDKNQPSNGVSGDNPPSVENSDNNAHSTDAYLETLVNSYADWEKEEEEQVKLEPILENIIKQSASKKEKMVELLEKKLEELDLQESRLKGILESLPPDSGSDSDTSTDSP